MSELRVAIVAGEPSGDMLAAKLLQALKIQSKVPLKLIGVGGDLMIKEGLSSAFPMSILSIGGYGFNVIKAIPKILYLRRKLIKQIIEFKADVFIGVDAPDFNFYIEKKLRQAGIKTVHYVSPTIWAWRYSRIFKIKRSTDLMLCVFPMEEAIYAKEHIKARFVGHHLADQIPLQIDTEHYKQQLGISGPLFCVLVGSRRSEIESLAELFIQTCNLIHRRVPTATFVFPLVNQQTYDLLQTKLSKYKINFEYKIFLARTNECICASDMVLAKSGTVTLEVALCKKPLIISYKVGKVTEWLLRKQLKIKYVGQPNILLNEEVAPELLQNQATPTNLANKFVGLYQDAKEQQKMIDKFYALHLQLKHDASLVAAHEILTLLENR